MLAVRSCGKGKVYQFGGIPSAGTSLLTWKAILEREGIAPDLEVHGEDADFFVETQLVEREVTIPAKGKLRRGPYRITALTSGKEFPTVKNSPVWNGKDDLLKLSLPAHGVEVLYFEKRKE